jgi:hypothetical protein
LKFQSLWIGSWWLQTLDKWFYCKHILILWIPLPVLVAQVIAVIRFWTWRMHILWLTIFWGANCCGPYVGLWESQLNQLVFLHKKKYNFWLHFLSLVANPSYLVVAETNQWNQQPGLFLPYPTYCWLYCYTPAFFLYISHEIIKKSLMPQIMSQIMATQCSTFQ